jgi:hypothetical protein
LGDLSVQAASAVALMTSAATTADRLVPRPVFCLPEFTRRP